MVKKAVMLLKAELLKDKLPMVKLQKVEISNNKLMDLPMEDKPKKVTKTAKLLSKLTVVKEANPRMVRLKNNLKTVNPRTDSLKMLNLRTANPRTVQRNKRSI